MSAFRNGPSVVTTRYDGSRNVTGSPISFNDVQRSETPISHTSLKRQITTTSFVYMALASSIGAGLLIASTNALRTSGPAALVLAFALVGLGVWLTMCALSELAATFPVQGSFYNYSVKNISPAWGFAMGLTYCINFILIVPMEITVMILVTRYWGDAVKTAWLVPLVQVCLVGIAAMGSGFFAKAEHVFGLVKVCLLVCFSMTAIIICCGGVKSDPRGAIGTEYWSHGAFLNGCTGFLSVFAAAGMAYGGTEMLGLTVAECKHPQRTASLASTITATRIIVCFLLPLLMLGFVLNPTQIKEFQENTGGTGSPFVIALFVAKIKVLPDMINTAIVLAIFSMANASVFASSRALHALCAQGMGPRIFARTTSKGVPIYALGLVFLFSCLAYINMLPEGEAIFDWLLALASTCNYFTWISISLSHIRMRLAMKRRNKTVSSLKWKSRYGIWGSVVAIAISVIGLMAMLATAAIPGGEKSTDPKEPFNMSLVRNGLGFIFVVGAWLGWQFFGRGRPLPWLVDLMDVDLQALDMSQADDGSLSDMEQLERIDATPEPKS
jgi:yeast amino acid transporter